MARDKAEPTADGPVTVLLLVGNVYLPEDPARGDWEQAPTRRYEGKTDGRRTRVACHPSLAQFLQDREQAEIIDR